VDRGTAVLAFRYRRKHLAYLRRFPPIDGVPLDMYIVSSYASLKALRSVWNRPQDPETEELRRALRRRMWHLLLWFLGFPLLVSVVVVTLILTGVVH
jgi:hypothetical protein